MNIHSELCSRTMQTQHSTKFVTNRPPRPGGFRTSCMKLDMSERRGHGTAACFKIAEPRHHQQQSHVAEVKPLTTLRPISWKFEKTRTISLVGLVPAKLENMRCHTDRPRQSAKSKRPRFHSSLDEPSHLLFYPSIDR